MALDIKVQTVTDRPANRSGRAGTSVLPELTEEVKPLIAEALKLPADKAFPVTVPADQVNDLTRALRAAGELENVTVRFLRHPRFDDNGEQVTKTREKDGVVINVTDPFQYTNKARSTVRVTFWTTKKVIRKSKKQGPPDHDIRNEDAETRAD